MALTFFWRCEGTTLDGTDDFSAGDTSATANGSVSLDAAAGLVGTNGILVTAGGQHYRFDTASILNRLVGSAGCSFRVTTNPSGLVTLLNLRGTAANDYVSLQINNGFGTTTGTPRMVTRSTDTGGVQTSILATGSGATLTTSTIYRAIIRWDQANSLRRLEVYDSSNTLLVGVTESSAWVAPLDLTLTTGVRIGEDTGTACAYHLDNIFISDVYAEPIEDFFDITSYTGYGSGGGEVAGTPMQNLSSTFGPARAARLGGVLQ